MADGVWKGDFLSIFGHPKQLSLNKFFSSELSFYEKRSRRRKKKRGGEKNGKKRKKRLMKIVATTSFASSQPPERRPLERRTLAPINHQKE